MELETAIQILKPEDKLIVVIPEDSEQETIDEFMRHLEGIIGKRFVIISGAKTIIARGEEENEEQ